MRILAAGFVALVLARPAWAEEVPVTTPAGASAPVPQEAPAAESAPAPEDLAAPLEATTESAIATETPATEMEHAIAEPAHEVEEQAAGAEHAPGEHAASAEHGGGEHGAAGGHEGGEHHAGVTLSQVVNFVLFFGALGILLSKPLGAFLRERKKAIADSLQAADQAEREAKAKLAEMQARLAGLETEVATILQTARDQASAEKEAIVARAKVEAERILAQAGAQVGEMEQASGRRLRTVAAELAVDMAREIVTKQMQPDDRRRVFDRALKGLQKNS